MLLPSGHVQWGSLAWWWRGRAQKSFNFLGVPIEVGTSTLTPLLWDVQMTKTVSYDVRNLFFCLSCFGEANGIGKRSFCSPARFCFYLPSPNRWQGIPWCSKSEKERNLAVWNGKIMIGALQTPPGVIMDFTITILISCLFSYSLSSFQKMLFSIKEGKIAKKIISHCPSPTHY